MASAGTAGVSWEYVSVASWRRSSRSPASVSSATPSGYTEAVGLVELGVVQSIVASPEPAQRPAVAEVEHQRDHSRPRVPAPQAELEPTISEGDEGHLHDNPECEAEGEAAPQTHRPRQKGEERARAR